MTSCLPVVKQNKESLPRALGNQSLHPAEDAWDSRHSQFLVLSSWDLQIPLFPLSPMDLFAHLSKCLLLAVCCSLEFRKSTQILVFCNCWGTCSPSKLLWSHGCENFNGGQLLICLRDLCFHGKRMELNPTYFSSFVSLAISRNVMLIFMPMLRILHVRSTTKYFCFLQNYCTWICTQLYNPLQVTFAPDKYVEIRGLHAKAVKQLRRTFRRSWMIIWRRSVTALRAVLNLPSICPVLLI